MATLTCSYCDRPCSSAEQAAGWCEYCKPRPMSPDQIAELAHSPEFRAMMAPHQKLLASLGEQPSITDRDPGDETIYAVNRAQLAQARNGGFVVPAGLLPDEPHSRIEELQAELDREKGRSQFWHNIANAHMTQGSRIAALEAENANLRADLTKLMASPPATATAPTPPPHDPMANALAHSEPKPPWQR